MEEQNQGTPKRGFGITTETKSENNVRMLPPQKLEKPSATFPSGYSFPIASLVNIVATKDKKTKTGVTDTLQFVFKDSEGRQYVHTEWKIDDTDAKWDKKMEGLNSRIKHLFVTLTGTFPEGGIGTDAKGFYDFFTKVKKTFDDTGIEFSKIPLYLKLTYYNDNLGFPLGPNFVQKVLPNKPCLLEIQHGYDEITPSDEGGSNIPGIPGGTAGGAVDVPTFGNNYN